MNYIHLSIVLRFKWKVRGILPLSSISHLIPRLSLSSIFWYSYIRLFLHYSGMKYRPASFLPQLYQKGNECKVMPRGRRNPILYITRRTTHNIFHLFHFFHLENREQRYSEKEGGYSQQILGKRWFSMSIPITSQSQTPISFYNITRQNVLVFRY